MKPHRDARKPLACLLQGTWYRWMPAHTSSPPGCPSCRDGTRWRSALAPPPAPPPLAASPVVNRVVLASLSLAPRTALTHTSYREPGRRACTEYWLRGGCSRKVVFPPSPPTRPYFRRMKSTLARGGVHSTKATVSETSRTRTCVGPSMTE